jgi:hypothetical protein
MIFIRTSAPACSAPALAFLSRRQVRRAGPRPGFTPTFYPTVGLCLFLLPRLFATLLR